MKCISPMQTTTKKDRHTVPCGRCGPCLSNKRNEWTFRLKEEHRTSKSAYFVTMTYDDDNIPLTSFTPGELIVSRGIEVYNSLMNKNCSMDDAEFYGTQRIMVLLKRDVQLFIKRLRAENEKVLTNLEGDFSVPQSFRMWPKLRYYCVGEYGPKTKRPHYHIILFNLFPTIKDKISEKWGMGQTHVLNADAGTIHYTTKYFITTMATDDYSKMLKSIAPQFTLMSTKPGIGYGYLERALDYHRNNMEFRVKHENGMKSNMPKYYRDKIFTKAECKINARKTKEYIDEKITDNIIKKGEQHFIEERDGKRQSDEIIKRTAIKKSKL